VSLSRLIEEAHAKHTQTPSAEYVKYMWDNTGNVAERVGSLIGSLAPGAGIGARAVGGYQAGLATGHPVVGAIFGREAALGAASNHIKDINVKDVYTKNNMINKAFFFGGTIGAAKHISMKETGSPTGLYDDLVPGGAYTVAGGLAVAAAASPAVKYGLGKAFGSKQLKPQFI